MASLAAQITIPNVTLELDQLLAVIRRLDTVARQRVAQALAESEMDARLGGLIHRLAAKTPADDLSDRDIDLEVQAVRNAHRNS